LAPIGPIGTELANWTHFVIVRYLSRIVVLIFFTIFDFRRSLFVSDFNFGNHVILFVDPGRKLMDVYIIRSNLHHVLPPLQTQMLWKFLKQLPDHNAVRETQRFRL
jgi:hypothetical protein